MTAVKKEQTRTEPVNSGLLNESQDASPLASVLSLHTNCCKGQLLDNIDTKRKHASLRAHFVQITKKKGSESFFGLHKVIQCAAIPFFLLETTDTGYDCVQG